MTKSNTPPKKVAGEWPKLCNDCGCAFEDHYWDSEQPTYAMCKKDRACSGYFPVHEKVIEFFTIGRLSSVYDLATWQKKCVAAEYDAVKWHGLWDLLKAEMMRRLAGQPNPMSAQNQIYNGLLTEMKRLEGQSAKKEPS